MRVPTIEELMRMTEIELLRLERKIAMKLRNADRLTRTHEYVRDP